MCVCARACSRVHVSVPVPRHCCWLQAGGSLAAEAAALGRPRPALSLGLCGRRGRAQGGGGSGGHACWEPSARGEESSPWICPGVVPNLQRWHGKGPAALPLLFEVLRGQDGFILLAASGLNYTLSRSLRRVSSQPGSWRGLTVSRLFCPPEALCFQGAPLQPCLCCCQCWGAQGRAGEQGRAGSRPRAPGPTPPCPHPQTSLSPRVNAGGAPASSAAAGACSIRAAPHGNHVWLWSS